MEPVLAFPFFGKRLSTSGLVSISFEISLTIPASLLSYIHWTNVELTHLRVFDSQYSVFGRAKVRQ